MVMWWNSKAFWGLATEVAKCENFCQFHGLCSIKLEITCHLWSVGKAVGWNGHSLYLKYASNYPGRHIKATKFHTESSEEDSKYDVSVVPTALQYSVHCIFYTVHEKVPNAICLYLYFWHASVEGNVMLCVRSLYNLDVHMWKMQTININLETLLQHLNYLFLQENILHGQEWVFSYRMLSFLLVHWYLSLEEQKIIGINWYWFSYWLWWCSINTYGTG